MSAFTVQDLPAEPACCATCGINKPKIFTTVLGWECLDCRAWRREHHTNPVTLIDSFGHPCSCAKCVGRV